MSGDHEYPALTLEDILGEADPEPKALKPAPQLPAVEELAEYWCPECERHVKKLFMGYCLPCINDAYGDDDIYGDDE